MNWDSLNGTCRFALSRLHSAFMINSGVALAAALFIDLSQCRMVRKNGKAVDGEFPFQDENQAS
jgi:hypothetical protein